MMLESTCVTLGGKGGFLTGKALESLVQVLDGHGVHVADISHQVGNLAVVST
jgi:hypothetical protein